MRQAMMLVCSTKGWDHVPVEIIFATLAEIGYDGVELAAGHDHLSPHNWSDRIGRLIARIAQGNGLRISNVHLGSLSRSPYYPSFIASDLAERKAHLQLMKTAIRFAAAMQVDVVSFASGPLTVDITVRDGLARFIDGLEASLNEAAASGIRLAIEPSPTHLIDSHAAYLKVAEVFLSPLLGLCYNVGHGFSFYEPLVDVISSTPALFHLHITDRIDNQPTPLSPGDGQIDLEAVLLALKRMSYTGSLSVELPHNDQKRFRNSVPRSFNKALPRNENRSRLSMVQVSPTCLQPAEAARRAWSHLKRLTQDPPIAPLNDGLATISKPL